jgi:hypothetical protein
VRLSLTKGMIAADFLADPPGTGLDTPSQTHRASGGLTAGSTKLAGERLWMMRCARRRLMSTAARAGRLWTLCTIEIEVAVRLGWSGMASP